MDKLTGPQYVKMVLNGYRDLKSHYEKINELNVFPVPDGDTGTNIASTMTGGVKAMAKADQNDLGDVSEKLSEGMLLGARGNSGVIISQFFAGLADSLAPLQEADTFQFAEALITGTQRAYEAVNQPVEGTILTVARESSQYVKDNIEAIDDFETLFTILLKQMNESLERTPDLLPVLKEAGVIDSGGAGLVYIIEGMSKEIGGEEVADSAFEGPVAAVAADEAIPFNEDSVMAYGYCTEFILQLQNCKNGPKLFDLKKMIEFLKGIGDSIVAVRQKNIVKVHVHTKEPWKAIQYAQKFGEFITFKMENMSIQHNEVLLKQMPIEEKKPQPRIPLAFVAVSPSDKISELFTDLGVSVNVPGGQTMNPSAQDLLNAFDEVNADTIMVFPNNGNVILTAEQAAKMYTKAKVVVVHTKSAVEAYSALTMTDPINQTLEENLGVIKSTLANLTTAEVSQAIRDTVNNGISIKKGNYIGILGSAVVATADNLIKTTEKTLDAVSDIKDKEVLTVFYGEGIQETDKEALSNLVNKTYPQLELVQIEGEQKIYPFVFAIE